MDDDWTNKTCFEVTDLAVTLLHLLEGFFLLSLFLMLVMMVVVLLVLVRMLFYFFKFRCLFLGLPFGLFFFALGDLFFSELDLLVFLAFLVGRGGRLGFHFKIS